MKRAPKVAVVASAILLCQFVVTAARAEDSAGTAISKALEQQQKTPPSTPQGKPKSTDHGQSNASEKDSLSVMYLSGGSITHQQSKGSKGDSFISTTTGIHGGGSVVARLPESQTWGEGNGHASVGIGQGIGKAPGQEEVREFISMNQLDASGGGGYLFKTRLCSPGLGAVGAVQLSFADHDSSGYSLNRAEARIGASAPVVCSFGKTTLIAGPTAGVGASAEKGLNNLTFLGGKIAVGHDERKVIASVEAAQKYGISDDGKLNGRELEIKGSISSYLTPHLWLSLDGAITKAKSKVVTAYDDVPVGTSSEKTGFSVTAGVGYGY